MDQATETMVQEFQGDRGLTELSPADAFEAFAAYCVVGQFYEDAFDPNAVRMGSAGDLGIDAAAIVINGELYTDAAEVQKAVTRARDLHVRFVIVQAKARHEFQPDVFTGLATNLHNVFRREELTYRASERVKDLRLSVDAIYSDPRKFGSELPKISVWYVTGGRLEPTTLAARVESAESILTHLDRFSDVAFHAAGAEQLLELYRRGKAKVTARVMVLLDQRVKLPPIPGVKKAFLGVIRAKDLVKDVLTDPVGNIRSVLFHDNVRSFLGYGLADSAGKGDTVNAQIRQTIVDDAARHTFAVLNNGITIVTRKLIVADRELVLGDFHIVNGCQSCYVLYDQRAHLDDDVYITVKIVESTDENLISGIVAATNRQNAITPNDLVAREKFHRTLEEFFEAQQKDRRLYYERRANQYADTSIEKTRIISRAQLTKAYSAMFLDEAHRATRLSELLSSHADDLFRPRHSVLQYYACASTYYRIDWMLRNGRLASTYSPARFHLIAGVKLLLLGPDRLPTAPRAHKASCEKIIDLMWTPKAAEAALEVIASALLKSLPNTGDGLDMGNASRTSGFRINVMNEILAGRSAWS